MMGKEGEGRVASSTPRSILMTRNERGGSEIQERRGRKLRRGMQEGKRGRKRLTFRERKKKQQI